MQHSLQPLLGLSIFMDGFPQGYQVTDLGRLFYSLLVDLGDAVADEMSLEFESISLERIYRGLYHFQVAHHKGLAADPRKYLAAEENLDLGIVKAQRKPKLKLIIALFPDATLGGEPFFFEPLPKIPLTTGERALTCHQCKKTHSFWNTPKSLFLKMVKDVRFK